MRDNFLKFYHQHQDQELSHPIVLFHQVYNYFGIFNTLCTNSFKYEGLPIIFRVCVFQTYKRNKIQKFGEQLPLVRWVVFFSIFKGFLHQKLV